MRSVALSRWRWLHTWSSLVCTLFLLVICLTGLPLVFAQQINAWVKPTHYAVLPADAPHVALDRLTARTSRDYPGQIVTSIFTDDDEPQVYVWLAPSFAAAEADPKAEHFVRFDVRSGAILGRSRPLHFGNYGGLPFKTIWALLDLVMIVVLGSGLYLWWGKHRRERLQSAHPPAQSLLLEPAE